MAKPKSWHAKLNDNKDLPKVVNLTDTGRAHWKAATMAIPSPLEVSELMAGVPKGQLITLDQIRQRVANRHHADIGCPLTCGLFAWIAAHAAEEGAMQGASSITPYWRTLKSGGELNPKYPGGIDNQKMRLEAEGHRIIQKGKRHFVENYQKFIAYAAD